MTSLSVASVDEASAIVFAGINSSLKDQEQGKNEHLRSFKLRYPPRTILTEDNSLVRPENIKEKTTETQALNKCSLFTPSFGKKQETYQRILRLSPRGSATSRRIGAVATGLAPAGEVVIFDASKTTPTSDDIRRRIQLDNGEEAGDVDIIERDESHYLVAYCTEYEVSLCVVPFNASEPTRLPYLVHAIPHPDVFASSTRRPTFRALRFLTPKLLLLVRNKPNRSGAEVLLLDVPAAPIEGSIVLRKTLHKGIRSVSCLAKTTMPSPKPTQNIQHVIAIAGQDVSLTILTLDHDARSNDSLSFRMHCLLHKVHPMQMTALTFSSFKPPKEPSKALPQYLKLASTSMCSTVKVHTFPLIPFPAYSKEEPSRYTLQSTGTRNEQVQQGFSFIVAVVVVAIGAFLLQAFTEIRGATPEYIGAKGWLSKSLYDKIALPYVPTHSSLMTNIPKPHKIQDEARRGYECDQEDLTSVQELREALSLKDVLARRRIIHADGPEGIPLFSGIEKKAVIVRDLGQELSTELHHDEEAPAKEGRKWEDLDHHEKIAWRKRLSETGAWAADEGEAVLKGKIPSWRNRVSY